MRTVESQEFARQVFHYYENVTECNLKNTFRHFTEEGKHRGTIFNIVQRYRRVESRSTGLSGVLRL